MMTAPADGDRSEASDESAVRHPVLARPRPTETIEEFSARFLAEILDVQRSQEQSGSDNA